MYCCSSLIWARRSDRRRTEVVKEKDIALVKLFKQLFGNCRESCSCTFGLERIAGAVCFVDIYDAVDVEGDLLGVGDPVLVAEAVGVFAVVDGREGVIAVGNCPLVDLVLAYGVHDLSK